MNENNRIAFLDCLRVFACLMVMFVHVVVPFAVWCALYVWRFDGKAVDCLFNFPMATAQKTLCLCGVGNLVFSVNIG